jgi:hypothetical protein
MELVLEGGDYAKVPTAAPHTPEAECRVSNAALSAEACFEQALDVARRQQAKSLELRVALSLARL